MSDIYESGEMYLEYILICESKNQKVHAIDVVKLSGYSKPSVSRALKKLEEQGYILLNGSKEIILTETGRALAESVYDRHEVLTQAFLMLGIPEEIASVDACRIEHVISEETFIKIKEHLHKK